MRDDAQLLESYVHEGSEPAFRELVECHIGLVNFTARRIVGGDAHLAQDVTQQVFADLARKARSLPGGMVLSGWLHRHTYYLACNAVRAERRRRARETTAAEMNSLHDMPTHDETWQQLSPVLDEALSCLATRDRDAIVLRYLEQHELGRIGEIIGASENTTHKRITRGLEKLRGFLERRGVTLSTALLATTLDVGAKMTVPADLAATVSTSALHSATIKTAFTLSSLKSMITTKLALGAAAAVALAGIATLVVAHKPAPPSSAPFVQAISPAAQSVSTSAPAAVAAISRPPARVEMPVLPQTPATVATTTDAPTTADTPVEITTIQAVPITWNSNFTEVKSGVGTLTLTTGNTYTGTTTVNSGTMTLTVSPDDSSPDGGQVIILNNDAPTQ